MRTLFHPYLPNGPDGDPVLWIDMLDEGHSVLLDLGELNAIPNRKLLRVGRVVVTHTHMDHFIGFDHLLRLALGREKALVVSGPPGFLRHVQGKIDAYSWNLIESYPIRLVAEEIDGGLIRSVAYSGASRMQPEPLPDRRHEGVIHAHRAYSIEVEQFDHLIPVLGIALAETEHLSVDKDRLLKLGLRPGAWLSELKNAVRRREPEDFEIEAEYSSGVLRRFRTGDLASEILFRTPGQKLVYLSDIRRTDENFSKAVALAQGADLLVCEAAFLHEDEGLAAERCHLTARQAGELARTAGVERLAPFHFSPRYKGREQELLDEAAAAFGGPVLRLPTGLG
jgi:ribonuclease Z